MIQKFTESETCWRSIVLVASDLCKSLVVLSENPFVILSLHFRHLYSQDLLNLRWQRSLHILLHSTQQERLQLLVQMTKPSLICWLVFLFKCVPVWKPTQTITIPWRLMKRGRRNARGRPGGTESKKTRKVGNCPERMLWLRMRIKTATKFTWKMAINMACVY